MKYSKQRNRWFICKKSPRHTCCTFFILLFLEPHYMFVFYKFHSCTVCTHSWILQGCVETTNKNGREIFPLKALLHDACLYATSCLVSLIWEYVIWEPVPSERATRTFVMHAIFYLVLLILLYVRIARQVISIKVCSYATTFAFWTEVLLQLSGTTPFRNVLGEFHYFFYW